MKAHIRERISGSRLRDTVPPAYRDEAVKGTLAEGWYTVILCPHNPRDVVTSPVLAKAFRKLEEPAPNGIIIVGSAFTEEAKAIAKEQGAKIVALHKSTWTDESANLRQL